MARNRYTRLLYNSTPHWAKGSPLLLAAHALTRDNAENHIVAQCRFENTTSHTILSAVVRLACYTADDIHLGDKMYAYEDIAVKPGGQFGGKNGIEGINIAARVVKVYVEKVVCKDAPLWFGDATLLQPVLLGGETTALPEELQSFYSSQMRQAATKKGAEHPYFTLQAQDWWVCGCGTANHPEDTACRACGVPLQTSLALADAGRLRSLYEAQCE